MTPQAPNAGEFQVPRENQEPVSLDTAAIQTGITEIEQYANHALSVAHSGRPRHLIGEPQDAALAMTARSLDQRWFEQETRYDIDPRVKTVLEFSNLAGQSRETFLRHPNIIEKIFNVRDSFEDREGIMGAQLWEDKERHITMIPANEVWDFRHIKRNGRHEWVLTRRDKATHEPLSVISYIIEHLPQGMTEIRKVRTIHGHLQQPEKNPDFLMFNRSEEEAAELTILAALAELYYKQVIVPLYGSK